jgi:hypothetical protein
LDSIEEVLRVDPYAAGEPLPEYEDENLWIWRSPPIARLPTMVIVYRIEKSILRVTLLSILLR